MPTFENDKGARVVASEAEASALLRRGYLPVEERQVAAERERTISDVSERATYDTAGDELAAAIQGFGEAASLGLVRPSKYWESAAMREEVNPLAHGAGYVGGVAATAFVPVGGTASAGAGAASQGISAAGRALNVGGEVAAKLVTRGGVSGMAARGAIEGGVYGAVEWGGSVIHGDPATMEGLASHVGFGGLIGGAFGGAVGMLSRGATRASEKASKIDEALDAATAGAAKNQEEVGELTRMIREADDAVKAGKQKVQGLEDDLVSSEIDLLDTPNVSRFDDEAARVGEGLQSYQTRLDDEISQLDATLKQATQPVEVPGGVRPPTRTEALDDLQRYVRESPGTAKFTADPKQQNAALREVYSRIPENAKPLDKDRFMSLRDEFDYVADDVRQLLRAGKIDEAQSAFDTLSKRYAPGPPTNKKEIDKLRLKLTKAKGDAIPDDLMAEYQRLRPDAAQVQAPPRMEAPQPDQALVSRLDEARLAREYIGALPNPNRKLSDMTVADVEKLRALGQQTPRLSGHYAELVLDARKQVAEGITQRFGLVNNSFEDLVSDAVLARRAMDDLAPRQQKIKTKISELKAQIAGESQTVISNEKLLKKKQAELAKLEKQAAKSAKSRDKITMSELSGKGEGGKTGSGSPLKADGNWFTRMMTRRFAANVGAQYMGWMMGGPAGWAIANNMFRQGGSVAAATVARRARIKASLMGKAAAGIEALRRTTQRVSTEVMFADFEQARDDIANIYVGRDALATEAGDPIRQFSPDGAEHLYQIITKGLTHLVETMPKNPGMGEDWRPAEQEMRAWGRRIEAVFKPYQALEKIATGAGGAEHIQTLKIVYPALMESMRADLADVNPKQLSRNQRLAYSLLTGEPAGYNYDPRIGMGVQQRMMAARQPKQPPQQGGMPAPPTQSSAATNKQATMADRVTER